MKTMKLVDLAKTIRSKNAGTDRITFDIIFRDPDGVNINNVKVSLKGEGKNLKMQNVANVTINGQKYENVGAETQELDF